MQEYFLLSPPPYIRPWGAGKEVIYFWNLYIFFKEIKKSQTK